MKWAHSVLEAYDCALCRSIPISLNNAANGTESALAFRNLKVTVLLTGLSTVPYIGYGHIETGSIRAWGTRNRNHTEVGKFADRTGRGSIWPYTGSYGTMWVRF